MNKQQQILTQFIEKLKEKHRAFLPLNIDTWKAGVITDGSTKPNEIAISKYKAQLTKPASFYKSISRTVNPDNFE